LERGESKKFSRVVALILIIGVTLGAALVIFSVDYWVRLPWTNRSEQTVGNENKQYYFAYGSNMWTQYLVRVRNIRPLSSEGGVLHGYSVRFTAPGPVWVEPAFASLHKEEGAVAYGVIHELESQDLAKVLSTEPNYLAEKVLINTLDGRVIEAVSLVNTAAGEARKPSRRYRDLMINGAKEHALPSDYVNQLAEQKVVYIPVFSEFFGTGIMLVAMIGTRL